MKGKRTPKGHSFLKAAERKLQWNPGRMANRFRPALDGPGSDDLSVRVPATFLPLARGLSMPRCIRLGCVALAFGTIWFLACRNLAVHWSANPIYSYGWLVPVGAVFAAQRRWSSRPAPGRARRSGLWLAAGAAFLFFPTWLFAQPNSDWSLMGWLLAGEAAWMTLGAMLYAGGFAWGRHFAFPIFFIFAAAPCPHFIEIPMTQGLMRVIAAVTVETLNACGIASVQHGNLIEVRSGLLGIAEACSGVRSLQAALAASLFLGELYRFKLLRRVGLLLLGLAVAVATNAGRTFFLAWSVSRAGTAAVERWHDPAGSFVLTICFAAIWAAAHFLGRHEAMPRSASGVPAGQAMPIGFLVGITLWFTATIGATEAWFHDGGKAPKSQWSLTPPPDGTEIEIDSAVERQLGCDRTTASTWREGDGGRWLLYFFEWRPGPTQSRVLARIHRPEVCLAATGLRMTQDRGTIEVDAGGIALPFRAFTFDQGGRPLFVYYCLWQNRSERAARQLPFSASVHKASVQAVLWRERNLGQQVAELTASGYENAAQADAGFRRVMPGLLIRRRE